MCATKEPDARRPGDGVRPFDASLLRAVVDTPRTAGFTLDVDGTFHALEGGAVSSMGLTPGQLKGQNALEFYAGQPEVIAGIGQALSGAKAAAIVEHNGATHELFLSPRRDAQGAVTGVLGVAVDISERTVMEAALRKSEADYSMLFEAMANGFAYHRILFDDAGTPIDYLFLNVNPAFEKLTGLSRERLIGRRVTEVLPGIEHDPTDWIGRYGKVALTGEDARFESYAAPLDQWFSVYAYCPGPETVVVVFEDITERKQAEAKRRRLEAEFQHVQRLESMGVLTSGIAHHFNNKLLAILGNAELLRAEPGLSPLAQEDLAQLTLAAQHCAELSRQLRVYAGESSSTCENFDLRQVFMELDILLRCSTSNNAKLIFNIPDTLAEVTASRSQVIHILTTLVSNASEALGEQLGTITVSARMERCGSECPCRSLFPGGKQWPAGPRVALQVDDTGCGMDEQARTRLFEPFFTTKFVGRGLGMSVAHGILRQHQAGCIVDSTPGKGTSITLHLPVQQDVSEPVRAPMTLSRQLGRSGTILLVDGDASVRRDAVTLLQMFGFSVTVADDGKAAMAAYERNRGAFVGALIDCNAPGMKGTELCAKLREVGAEIPLFLCTGTKTEADLRQLSHFGVTGIISKPYARDTLQASLSAALAS